VAQKVQVILEDDIDGGPADETVIFALDGANYEIDLSSANAQRLRDALAEFVGHARRAGRSGGAARVNGTSSGSRSSRSSGSSGSSSSGGARADREQTQAIREWARSNGYDVKPRGRVPANIVEAYNSAH
jgi:hypothetical protein